MSPTWVAKALRGTSRTQSCSQAFAVSLVTGLLTTSFVSTLHAAPQLDQSLDEKNKLTSPALPEESKPEISGKTAADIFLKPEDLSPILASRGISCQTSSIGHSPFSKNFSNFGGECFNNARYKYYETADVTLIQDQKSKLTPRHSWNVNSTEDLVAPVKQRVVVRGAQAVFKHHPVLSDLVSGRFQLAITPDTWWDDLTTSSKPAQRPRYIVLEESVPASGRLLNQGTKVASLGTPTIDFVTQDAAHQDANVPKYRRRLIEEFSNPAPSQTSESLSDDTKSAEQSSALQPLSARKRIQRTLGVSTAPFSRFDLRFSRSSSSTSGSEDLALRFSEGNGIVTVEFPTLLADSDTAYGFNLPYQKHTFSVYFPDSEREAIRRYAYKVDTQNLVTVEHNPNSEWEWKQFGRLIPMYSVAVRRSFN
jgi:hypothetical protein